MKALFDINVVLDIVGRREPFVASAESAYLHAVEKSGKPFLAAHAYATLFYLLGASATKKRRDAAMNWVFESFAVAAIGERELAAARSYAMADFEDAMVVAAAESAGCDFIVTRNGADFADSPVPAVSPDEFLLENS
ncbi:MAG: PIN domain-containing protein [Kiritimatiellae bacterium]|nr:PIN domain-containing protein [Kiritimatiellia bacterium]